MIGMTRKLIRIHETSHRRLPIASPSLAIGLNIANVKDALRDVLKMFVQYYIRARGFV